MCNPRKGRMKKLLYVALISTCVGTGYAMENGNQPSNELQEIASQGRSVQIESIPSVQSLGERDAQLLVQTKPEAIIYTQLQPITQTATQTTVDTQQQAAASDKIDTATTKSIIANAQRLIAENPGLSIASAIVMVAWMLYAYHEMTAKDDQVDIFAAEDTGFKVWFKNHRTEIGLIIASAAALGLGAYCDHHKSPASMPDKTK